MLLVQATRDALLKTLSTVVGIVERRQTLPILANVLISKQGSEVSFMANDMEMQITTRADFGVDESQEQTTVAARVLLDILRAMPELEEVGLRLQDNKLIVQSAHSRFALQTMDAAGYPAWRRPINGQRPLPYLSASSNSCSARCILRWHSRTFAIT